MNKSPICLLLFAAVCLGCNDSVVDLRNQVDTRSMVGMTYEAVLKKHALAEKLAWETPNLAPGEDARTTYFLDKGDLDLCIGEDGTIKKAQFLKKATSAKTRYDEITQSWSKYINDRTSDPSSQ